MVNGASENTLSGGKKAVSRFGCAYLEEFTRYDEHLPSPSRRDAFRSIHSMKRARSSDRFSEDHARVVPHGIHLSFHFAIVPAAAHSFSMRNCCRRRW